MQSVPMAVAAHDAALGAPKVMLPAACLNSTTSFTSRQHANGAFEPTHKFSATASAEVLQWLNEAEEGELPAAHPQAGFVRIAFTHAFHQLLRQAGYRQAILDILALGGDTDTNACIVGALQAVLTCDTDIGQPRPERFTSRHVPFYLDTLVGYCL